MRCLALKVRTELSYSVISELSDSQSQTSTTTLPNHPLRPRLRSPLLLLVHLRLSMTMTCRLWWVS